MNLFTQYAQGQPSMESEPVVVEPIEVTPAVEETTSIEEVEQPDEFHAPIDTDSVDDTMATLASLESLADDLAAYHTAGYAFTDSHAKLLHTNLLILGGMNRSVPASIIPSLESDNPHLRTDIIVSMESVGEAVKAGAKAFWEAIKKFFADLKSRLGAMLNTASVKAKRAYQALAKHTQDIKVKLDPRIISVPNRDPNQLLAAINSMANLGVSIAANAEWGVMRQNVTIVSAEDPQKTLDIFVRKIQQSLSKISFSLIGSTIFSTFTKYGYEVINQEESQAPSFKYTAKTPEDKNYVVIPLSSRKEALGTIAKVSEAYTKSNVANWADDTAKFYNKLSAEYEANNLTTDKIRASFESVKTYIRLVQFSYILPTHVLERITAACNHVQEPKEDLTKMGDNAKTVQPTPTHAPAPASRGIAHTA